MNPISKEITSLKDTRSLTDSCHVPGKTRFLEECLASLHLPAADLPDELKPHAHLLSSCAPVCTQL
jgi:hypothetical protein